MPQIVSGTDIAHVIAQQGRYEMAIGKEFSLVADRMTWLVISQSFLMSAFVLSSATYDAATTMKLVLRASQVLMPAFGIVVAFLIIVAVKAAHSAAEKLKNSRDALEQTLPENLRVSLIGNTTWESDRGNWPPHVIPYVVLLVWAILLVVIVVTVV